MKNAKIIKRMTYGGGYYQKVNAKPGHIFTQDINKATKFYDKESLTYALQALLPYFSYLRGIKVERI